MEPIEIIVLIACIVIVASVIIYSLIRKKQGKCSCGCSDCPHSSACASKSKGSDNK